MNDTKHQAAMPYGQISESTGQPINGYFEPGLTKAEYAALVTGQPCSGTPWLDEMLAKARRERLAGQALAGLYVGYADNRLSIKECSQIALDAADDLITELERGAK